MSEAEIAQLAKALAHPFYTAPDFWINLVVGLVGVGFSVLAFREAAQAKVAAKHAGRSVKIQTVVLDLTETSMKLDRIEPDIKYTAARDLLSETSRRINRAISPFADDDKLKASIETLRQGIADATTSLNQVRPTSPGAEEQAPQAVYNAVEMHFSAINNHVASLIGLLEKQASNFGE